MCLNWITAQGSTLPETMEAYKIVSRMAHVLPPRYFPSILWDFDSLATGAATGEGWELRADLARIETNYSCEQTYLPGVHAWPSLASAKGIFDASTPFRTNPNNYRIVKVRLEGPICEGTQDHEVVVVYKKMIILEEIPHAVGA